MVRFIKNILGTWLWLGALSFALLGAALAAEPGSLVIVVYNSSMPESKLVASHYARARSVPADRVIGLDLPKTEAISRREFTRDLQGPLLKALEKRKVFVFSKTAKPVQTVGGSISEWIPPLLESSIRYAVLCYGVPLKVSADSKIDEPGFETVRAEYRRNEASVEAELALLPLAPLKIPLSGPFPNRFYNTTNASRLNPTNGVLMVARLDGPTPEIAMGLVDKAISAETNGLWGRAYFDARGITNGSYQIGDEWIRSAAQICRRFGIETVSDNSPATFSAAFPLSHVALYAGWYDGQVSGPFARPKVEFMPGAFAYHLHSYSAQTIRDPGRNWVGPLLAKGVTATMGSVEEPYLDGTPDIQSFFARFLFLGFSFGEAAYASQNLLSWQTTVIGDPLYRPFAKHPGRLHEELEARKSPFTEWAQLRVANLNLATGIEPRPVIDYLRDVPEIKWSAVLNEKVGDLYELQGKSVAAIEPYRTALGLKPSEQQKVRLTLNLTRLLTAFGQGKEAYGLYKNFLEEFPAYPDLKTIYNRILPLAQKFGTGAEIEAFERAAQ